MKGESFRIGPWLIDPGSLTVSGPGGQSRLQARTMSLLVVLQASRGQAVAKDELSDRVWGEQGASDELIARHVSKIRHALKDDARQSNYLETIPKIGYRLIDDAPIAEPERPAPRPSMMLPISMAVLAIMLTVWLITDQDPTTPPLRLLESGLALLADEKYRGDLAAAPGHALLGFVQSEKMEVGGPLLVHNLKDDRQSVISEGWNRFPSFSPDGQQIAAFGAGANGQCVVTIHSIEGSSVVLNLPCQGEPVSPPAWLDARTLLIAEFDPEQRQSQLEQIDIPTGARARVYQSDPDQLLRFPRVVSDTRLVALLSTDNEDTLLELTLESGQFEVIHRMPRGAVRWVDTHPGGERILIVKTDSSGRFALFEAHLDERVVRLIGNKEPAQSASYHPDGDGVLYAAVRYQRHHLLHQRDADNRFSARRLSLKDESVPYALLDPTGQQLLYLNAARPGMNLSSVRISNSEHSTLLKSVDGERLGFPAWSADGSRVMVAASGAAGNALYVIDSESQQLIGRFPIEPKVGPVQFNNDGTQGILTEQLGSAIKIYRLDFASSVLQPLFEVDGQWGQMSLDEQAYHYVDKNYMLHEVIFMADGPRSRVITPVGSMTGWRVESGILYFACPQGSLTRVQLCEMALNDETVVLHPEVEFSPIRLSVSADGNTLVAPWYDDTRLILTHARWARTDGMDHSSNP
jgi:DNA-binding winged helix-turn-helix (wHTH) protein/Tol biopolymer transport system component